MGLKKSSRMSKSWPLNKSALDNGLARVKSSMHFKWDDGATTIFLVAVGIAAAVMVDAAVRSRKPAEVAAANAQPKVVSASAQVRATRAPEATTAKALPETSTAKSSDQESPVTLTGCLELDNQTFRLKDTTGADAPKSRSWKSGFLKKKTASIAIVDAANKVKLPNHVGERVVVTGTLVDREMQVRSLQRVALSCQDA